MVTTEGWTGSETREKTKRLHRICAAVSRIAKAGFYQALLLTRLNAFTVPRPVARS